MELHSGVQIQRLCEGRKPLRIEFPGAVYYITSRGNALEEIYLGDADREAFLGVLVQAVARFLLLCHAYWATTTSWLGGLGGRSWPRGMRHLNAALFLLFTRVYVNPLLPP